MENLEELRKELDKLNKEILALLSRRGELALKIRAIKEKLGLPIYDSRREQEILDELMSINPGPYPPKAIKAIFSQILKSTVELMQGDEFSSLLVSKKNRIVLNKPIEVRGVNLLEKPFYIAGPCSVESYEQMDIVASGLKKLGVKLLRGGAFKPRTSPYSFQGLGLPGLKILREVADHYEMIVVTEVMDTRKVELVAEYGDILQIGARNMYNYDLLKEVGRVKKPVLLKRAFSATIEEFLQAAEYIALEGNDEIILCERGIRTFERSTRNTLDISGVVVLKTLTYLPIVVDISHAAGRRDILTPLASASFAAGAIGVMVEVHPNPSFAKSDNEQQLSLTQFAMLIKEVNQKVPSAPKLPDESTFLTELFPSSISITQNNKEVGR